MAYTAHLGGEPVAEWRRGKQFIITPGRVSFAFTPIDAAGKLQPGDTIRFLSATATPSLTDTDDTLLSFTSQYGDTISYRLNETPDSVHSRQLLNIPFTIEKSLIDKASSLLKGNRYYITTPVWFNGNNDNITGRKLIPVDVDSVTAGNDTYPLAVYFTDHNDMKPYHVYMSTGNTHNATRNFDTLFSLSDPRVKYKDIKDDVWDYITRSSVKIEMTREECRLALGNPREVIRGHYLERWTYDNGISLIFDDGYLQQIRR